MGEEKLGLGKIADMGSGATEKATLTVAKVIHLEQGVLAWCLKNIFLLQLRCGRGGEGE